MSNGKQQLTISFSGGSDSHKEEASVFVLTLLREYGIDVELLNAPNCVGMAIGPRETVAGLLRRKVKVLLVDYRK